MFNSWSRYAQWYFDHVSSLSSSAVSTRRSLIKNCKFTRTEWITSDAEVESFKILLTGVKHIRFPSQCIAKYAANVLPTIRLAVAAYKNISQYKNISRWSRRKSWKESISTRKVLLPSTRKLRDLNMICLVYKVASRLRHDKIHFTTKLELVWMTDLKINLEKSLQKAFTRKS